MAAGPGSNRGPRDARAEGVSPSLKDNSGEEATPPSGNRRLPVTKTNGSTEATGAGAPCKQGGVTLATRWRDRINPGATY